MSEATREAGDTAESGAGESRAEPEWLEEPRWSGGMTFGVLVPFERIYRVSAAPTFALRFGRWRGGEVGVVGIDNTLPLPIRLLLPDLDEFAGILNRRSSFRIGIGGEAEMTADGLQRIGQALRSQ